MLQTSAAVEAAHDAGIIHRDLKPANIFIVQNAEHPAVVKVLDFGIAKLAAESLEDDDHKSLTAVGAMIGTPRYMSPEQCYGVELTPAADVYSLGVILYEMLTGVVPFSGSTPLSIAMKHFSEAPRPLREFMASIPPALEEVVLHALEKRPEDRPANAAEFRRELFTTAERLGLEHAAVTTAPDIEALRDVGTESPSGRLVIDISRLREHRAAISNANEMTVISAAQAAEVLKHDGYRMEESSVEVPSVRHSFPRVSVQLSRGFEQAAKRPLLLLAGIIAVVLFVGAGFLAIRSQSTQPPVEPIVVATPTPTAEPTPSPTPTPKPSPRKPPPANANKKKDSKIGSALKKVKRVFKNPF
jgi:eukaryotic-like serine/threonine-protein kinase